MEFAILKAKGKKVNAKNIAFVNCEWIYKGYMTNKKASLVNGDGVTIDNKLYIMKEVNLTSQFGKLEILAKRENFRMQRNHLYSF